MGILTIAPAVRQGSHVIIGLYGESGSGKTLSALYIARGLVGSRGRIGFMDTETGRGRIYANEAGGFEYAELTPPFTPERYTTGIAEFAEAGVDVLVIDSASHEWEGIGGILEQADKGDKKGLQKWMAPKIAHKKFVQAMLRTRMHLILCLRAKEKMIQQGSEIVSGGLVSVQDKRFIFEMTVQCQMENAPGRAGHFILEKCPKDLLGAFPAGDKISIATGEKIASWVADGAPIDHGVDGLKKAGEDAAAGGMVALRKWFSGLKKADQLAVKSYLDGNLKSIAETADQPSDDIFDEAPVGTQVSAARPAFLDGALARIKDCDGPAHLAEIQAQVIDELKAAKASPEVISEWNAACKGQFEALSATEAA